MREVYRGIPFLSSNFYFQSMRTGIYEPYRNHFPLKQSQVPACQQPAPRLPYGAYDPTKAKLRSQIT